jgi:hypothetical protein
VFWNLEPDDEHDFMLTDRAKSNSALFMSTTVLFVAFPCYAKQWSKQLLRRRLLVLREPHPDRFLRLRRGPHLEYPHERMPGRLAPKVRFVIPLRLGHRQEAVDHLVVAALRREHCAYSTLDCTSATK